LRFGAIADEDWLEQDPGTRTPQHPYRVLRLRRARYLTIAGTVTADPEHPLAKVIGDALVTSSSAGGLTRQIGVEQLFPDATQHLFPKVTHIALAHHEDAHAVIDAWWPSRPEHPPVSSSKRRTVAERRERRAECDAASGLRAVHTALDHRM
jgi:hypothetical protein